MTRILTRMALAAMLIASLTCGGGGDGGTGPTPPDPGLVDVVLATPTRNDGALLLSISGAVVSSVIGQSFEVASVGAGSSTVKLLVRGNLTDGVIAQITVPDRNKLSSYQVTVNQAAARTTYQQQPLAGYAVNLSPAAP